VAEEGLSSAAVVQAYGREDDEAARFRQEGQKGLEAQLAAARLRGWFALLVDLIQLAGGLAVVTLGTWGLANGFLTLGGLLVFVTYLGNLYGPVRGLASFVNTTPL
jgi:ABC-type multidrug transport system fused ATPase/permease subunit